MLVTNAKPTCAQQQLLFRSRVPNAPPTVPANSLVVLAEVLGSRSVVMPATQNLIIRGERASKPANTLFRAKHRHRHRHNPWWPTRQLPLRNKKLFNRKPPALLLIIWMVCTALELWTPKSVTSTLLLLSWSVFFCFSHDDVAVVIMIGFIV